MDAHVYRLTVVAKTLAKKMHELRSHPLLSTRQRLDLAIYERRLSYVTRARRRLSRWLATHPSEHLSDGVLRRLKIPVSLPAIERAIARIAREVEREKGWR